MTNLAARLEAATEPSRELSDAVLEAAGWERFTDYTDPLVPCWHNRSGRVCLDGHRPHPTADLNAIVAMVEAAGLIWNVARSDNNAERFIGAQVNAMRPCYAATPALALSAALVRALEK